MKRSEAIETLVLNSKLPLSDIENLMELIEMAVGMLPPPKTVKNVFYPTFGMPTMEINEWESEDDYET